MTRQVKDFIRILPILVLLWNPIVLWIYFKSISIALLISGIIICLGAVFSRLESLRIKVWAFNLCFIVSILFTAEVIFSMVYPTRDIPNLYELRNNYYFNKAYLDQEFKNEEFISRYKTNKQGYRIDDLTAPNIEINKCDWLFIGDSFTQGAQVDYKDLFSSLIYKDFPDKIIVNAGISGAGLFDELNYFKDKGKQLKPKKVFLQISAFNDFMNVVETNASFQDYIMEWSSLYRYFEYNILNTEELPLGRWTEPFFPNIEDNIDNNIFFKQTSVRKEFDKESVKQCLELFKNEVESNGGELILIYIPSKEQTSPQLLAEVMNAYGIKKNEIDLSIPSRLCDTICRKLNIKYIDLTSDFTTSKDFPFFAHDEHMNVIGHQIIAKKIILVYNKIRNRYLYISSGNTHDRYPSFFADGSLLYQSQTEDYYLIENLNVNSGNKIELWRGVNELVHPAMSKSHQYLCFTEGDQEHSETDVILYDYQTNKKMKLNDNDHWAAIPSFNRTGTMIVYPEWTKDNNIGITLYNISNGKKSFFNDGVECWRPIFSKNDSLIYYIQKDNFDSHFAIKSYNISSKKKEFVLKLPYDIWDITLSPSGKYIAYAGFKNGNWDLFALSLYKKQAMIQLTNTIGDEWDPSFGITDYDLWFAGTFGINDGIYRMKVCLQN